MQGSWEALLPRAPEADELQYQGLYAWQYRCQKPSETFARSLQLQPVISPCVS
jgi:hypothetical protein